MIYRIRPTKDTFITDFRRNNVPQTGSNLGSSEILHLFRIAPISMSAGIVSGSAARILSQFDVSSIPGLTGSLNSGSVSFKLRMKNAQHGRTLPSSFDVEVLSMTTSWDEGRGHDTDLFLDAGYANWDKAKSNALWTSPGGDFSSPISTAHFDRGDEDLELDVTQHVLSWLSGSPNYGFMVKLSSSLETGTQDYYVKMFHSRESHFGDYLPYLEASWDDSLRLTGSVSFASGSNEFFTNVTNLKSSYETDETVRLHLFVRNRDYNPAVVLTASSSPQGIVVDRSFYRIVNDRTDEVVVPFGTGSAETTRLSYDSSGSYFDFRMDTLPPGNVYRLSFLFDIAGQKQIIDQGFKFKVV